MNFFQFRLRNAPFPAKIMIAGFLISLGLAYGFAIANIALVVGLTPKDIAIHYYGAEKTVTPENIQPGEQSLNLDEVDSATKTEIGPRPSLKNLIQEAHFHLFGMTSFFFCLTLLALFTNLNDTLKSVIVGLPFLAIIFDNLSFLATRFLGPHFAYLTAIAGGFMGLCFTALWISVGLEILKKGQDQ